MTNTKETAIEEQSAKMFIYDAFTKGKFPVSLFKTVHDDYFGKDERTIWGMENSFTEAFKKLLPVSQYEQTARLGKYLSATDFSNVIDVPARELA